MVSAGGAPLIPSESMEHRLERSEHGLNLLELREKKRSILAVPTLEHDFGDLEPDYDLSTQDWPSVCQAIFAFTEEAQTTDRATLRTRWPVYKGKVPDALAREIVEGVGK